jgi:hypothetical protein
MAGGMAEASVGSHETQIEKHDEDGGVLMSSSDKKAESNEKR